MSSELTVTVHRKDDDSPRPDQPSAVGLDSSSGRLLRRVLELLETAGIPHCVLQAELNDGAAHDVKLIVPPELLLGQLRRVLVENREWLGASIAQWRQDSSSAHHCVLATDVLHARRSFLTLEVASDYRVGNHVWYKGEEVLASRRWHRGFWVPSVAIEFGYRLVEQVVRQASDVDRGPQLAELYHQDPAPCAGEIARFWGGDRVDLIRSRVLSGEWKRSRGLLASVRSELLLASRPRDWQSAVRYHVAEGLRRLRDWRAPAGVHVVLLGADGAGKSATLAALEKRLAPAFRVATLHLAPALARRTRPTPQEVTPHSMPPRSLTGSLAKAAYWMIDYTLGYYLKVRPVMTEGSVVAFDRYLLDALVDPARYRYGGPQWVLRGVWSLIPKPDLIILLDAPLDVLRARKQEVSVEETERQRRAYRKLVEALPTGHVVDAAQPLEDVVETVGALVLDILASRTLSRVESHSPSGPVAHTIAVGSFDPESGECRATGAGEGRLA